MKHLLLSLSLLVAMVLSAQPAPAQTFAIDPVHSFTVFRVRHANIGYIWGRFNDPAGTITLDPDASKDSFNIEIQAGNIDTHQEKRDAHLKSPDFLNARQFPVISFKSTAVKKVSDTRLDVTGDLTLHGVTKSITVPVEITGTGEFPPGSARVGIEATFAINTPDFEIKAMPGMVGQEVRLMVALEAVKK